MGWVGRRSWRGEYDDFRASNYRLKRVLSEEERLDDVNEEKEGRRRKRRLEVNPVETLDEQT